MTTALIDGDIITYRSAASCKAEDPLQISIIRADIMLRELLSKVGCSDYRIYLSGPNNFRHRLYPEYKANRRDIVRPPHLEDTRAYLVLNWNADVTEGIEADDALGIYMGEHPDAICCSIDKDLLQLPGTHFNIVKAEYTTVDELTGWRTFYKQILLGDRSDNIPGYDGMARQKPTKQIEAWYDELSVLTEPLEMWEFVKEKFEDADPYLTAQLVYIWRKEEDIWTPPSAPEVVTK